MSAGVWNEKEIGEYMAAALLDSKRHILVGDPIQGFGSFSKWTDAMDSAFYAKTAELECRRREFVKSHRRSLRKSQQGINAIDSML